MILGSNTSDLGHPIRVAEPVIARPRPPADQEETDLQSLREMIGGWIRSAASETRIHLIQLSDSESAKIVAALHDHYVIGNPWAWWMSLSMAYDTWDSREVNISSILPTLSDQVYFIPEAARNHPHVYRVRAGDLERLIDNCPGFEYNVASLDGSWLLAESDHDIFYLCKSSQGVPEGLPTPGALYLP